MELARPFETCLNVSTVKLCVYLKYFQDLVSFSWNQENDSSCTQKEQLVYHVLTVRPSFIVGRSVKSHQLR